LCGVACWTFLLGNQGWRYSRRLFPSASFEGLGG
jgi:hypothetical protein